MKKTVDAVTHINGSGSESMPHLGESVYGLQRFQYAGLDRVSLYVIVQIVKSITLIAVRSP